MRLWKKSLVLASAMVMLGGCFKSEAPKCSDPQVIGLVKQIYAENVAEMAKTNPMFAIFKEAIPSQIVSIDSARPVKYDENIKLRSCKAVARFDDNRTANIEYTVQLDEKKSDQFYVEMKFDFLQGLAQQGMMQKIMHDVK
ncbi:hypothetical protein [Hydrogenimonas sp. SS33]|uniref:hypothetical protein n=1 Tax=Hydrogenimonas leucolamina TaxID=2954236 RepID=UPI00336BD5C8